MNSKAGEGETASWNIGSPRLPYLPELPATYDPKTVEHLTSSRSKRSRMGTCSHVSLPLDRANPVRRVIDDTRIRETIDSLAEAGERVTARRLRAELKSRFGHSGNSVRVHRQLQLQRLAESHRHEPEADLRASLEEALRDAAAWKSRAELAQHRERKHQDKWALEIDQLRERVVSLQAEIKASRTRADDYLKLYEDRERLALRVKELEFSSEEHRRKR